MIRTSDHDLFFLIPFGRYLNIGDRKLDRDSHSHSRNNLIGRTCENVMHEWILSKRCGGLLTDFTNLNALFYIFLDITIK